MATVGTFFWLLGLASFGGIISNLGCHSLAIALPIAQLYPTVSPTAKPDQPAQKLLGQWLSKEPFEGETVMAVFTTEGKLFVISGTSASGNGIVRQFRYQVDSTSTPSHLDIAIGSNAVVRTLFEFTSEGNLRVQMLGTRPSQPRPTALDDNATVFQKISDSVELPPGVEVKHP